MNADGATTHTSFVIERRFRASPARIFRAWADPIEKRRWADCHDEAGLTEHDMDFRLGGLEHARQVLPDGRRQEILTAYIDIVPERRIVFAYSMSVEGRCMSASLVTIALRPCGDGTSMRFTEQIGYFDGHDDLDLRRQGTEEGFDRLAAHVEP